MIKNINTLIHTAVITLICSFHSVTNANTFSVDDFNFGNVSLFDKSSGDGGAEFVGSSFNWVISFGN